QATLVGQVASAHQTETISIDAQAPGRAFPHYWERMFGSGRAILSLRESYRRDLREVKQATDFEYIRFHAIFHDEVGLYNEDADGKPSYNFSYVDQIYDGLLANGVRPFVELSFMPEKLASTPSRQAFWYKPFNSPPKDWDRWGAFIRHCQEQNVPVDFVSTHVYGNDSAEDVFGTRENIPRDQMVWRAVKKVRGQVKASAMPGLPIIFSEYNASYMNEVDVTDSSFMGPWLADTILQCDGLVDILAYWAF